MGKLEGIRKIAVLRANGLGDYLFVVPALHALKAAYPTAELVYLGCPWHKSFVENRPGPVDRVVVLPISRGVRTEEGKEEDPNELHEFFQQTRHEKFDLAVQLHGGGRNSNPFVLKLGGRITAGLRTPDAPELDITVPYIYYQNEVVRYLEVARAVGAQVVSMEPITDVTDEDIAEAYRVIDMTGARWTIIHPGATDSRRRWPAEKFAAVGDYLASRGLTVGVTGTIGEEEVVGKVMSAMHQPAVNLCGRLSLSGLTGLLSLADLVISNDSGPLHLAASVGTPTVGIFWCGNLINGGPFMRTRHRPAISWMIVCPRCGMDIASAGYPFQPGIVKSPATGTSERADRCDHPYSFVERISVDEVIESASDLLKTGVSNRHAA